MAGHSKWAQIKRTKAVVDAKRGAVFTRLGREVMVAARGGADPAGNFQLRTAIEKARAAGVPNANIERAIAKGAGQGAGGGEQFEAVRYEGYGPGGVAVLIEAFTDNRNRTAADLRVAFGKNGGNLGETGCVSWMFDQKGVVCLAGVIEEETLLEVALEGEAESYEIFADEEEPGAEVFTTIAALDALTKTLQAHFTVKEAEWRWIPSTSVTIEDVDQGKSLIKLMDALEGLDDVQNVTANFEFTDGVLALI